MKKFFCPSCGFCFQIPEEVEEKVVENKPKVVNGIVEAEPKVSDYRERFKKHRLTGNDVVAPPSKINNQGYKDTEMDKFGDLVVGEGLSVEY